MLRRTRRTRASFACVATGLLCMAFAPSAFAAATLTKDADGALHYTSTTQTNNDVYVQNSGDDIRVFDGSESETIVAAAGSECTPNNDSLYDFTCTGEYTRIIVDLGPGSDSGDVSVDLPTVINGGDDGDTLRFFPSDGEVDVPVAGTLNGDGGSDQLRSGEGPQTLNGGTGGDFHLDGGDGDDVLNGGDGNDYLSDAMGDQWNDGDPNGNDTLNGDAGDDEACDGQGDEKINGGDGNDTLTRSGINGPGNCGNSIIWNAAARIGGFAPARGANVVHGDAGDDRVYGGSDNDQLFGDAGDDDMYGSPGNDISNGGAGNDEFEEDNGAYVVPDGDGFTLTQHYGDTGADTYIGGTGRDFIEYVSHDADGNEHDDDVTITLDGVADDGGTGENDNVGNDIEDIETGDGNDTIVASEASNIIYSGSGNDAIDARGGSDRVAGGADIDSIHGGTGNDDVFGDFGSEGHEAGALSHTGSPAADLLDGGPGNDNLFGEFGNDTLRGGDDNDGLYGGQGSDDLSGGQGSDFVDYTGYGDRVIVTLDDVANDGPIGEDDNVRVDVEDVIGGFGNDDITGSAAANTLSGGSGNDTINSRDTVSDLVICGPGVDTALVDNLDVVDTTGDDRCERVEVAQIPGPPAPPRVSPKSLSSSLTPKRDLKFPHVFTVRGTLSLPAGVTAAEACNGKVSVQFKKGKSTISRRLVNVGPDCKYSSRVAFAVRSRLKGIKTLRVLVRFQGNLRLLPESATTKRARIRR